MKTIKRLLSSIPLFIIGAVIVRQLISIGDDCTGWGSSMIIYFSFLCYTVLLSAIVIVSLFQSLRHKSAFNFYPLITTLIVLAAIIIAFNADEFKSPLKLHASSQPRHDISYGLTLRENGRFVAAVNSFELSCFYKGKYEIKNDTLRLLRTDIQAVTEDAISPIYLIDRKKKLLYPIDKYTRDTTFWLVIEESKN